jgi:regulator of sigma E protease
MLNLLISVIGILLTIFFVVGVHELGHFLMARAVGIKVLRFSIGFGKTLRSWTDKKGTEYVIAAIPLGGYVKMLDESEGDVPKEELHLTYNRQPIYKKMAVVAMGPISNLLFAFLIYWSLFMFGFTTSIPLIGKIDPHSIAAEAGLKPQQEIVSINDKSTPNWVSVMINLLFHAGDKDTLKIDSKSINSSKIESHNLQLANWKLDELRPDPLESLGIIPFEPEIPAIIGETLVQPSKLQKGDKILAVDGVSIKDWYALVEKISLSPEKTLKFKIIRNNQVITLPVEVGYKRTLFSGKVGFLGIAPDFKWPAYMLRTNQYGPIAALPHAWQDLRDFTVLNVVILGKIVTGKVSFKSLGGPITIFESAGTALNRGFLSFMSFLAFLSISIGVINVLPIPGLDGGHVLFQIIEMVLRRPVSINVQILFIRLGLILLILVMIQALVNDILRLY